jgi:NAD+ synthase (glutamine-hydrolysing)
MHQSYYTPNLPVIVDQNYFSLKLILWGCFIDKVVYNIHNGWCKTYTMNKEVNFAVAQMDVTPNRPDVNFAKIIKETEAAKKRKIDIILFPEMALPGYLLGDEWENDSFIADCMEFNERILAASQDIAIVWGSVYADFTKLNEDGRIRKYNAAHVAQDGQWVSNGVFEGHTYKTLMPKYREFDDERYFYSMRKLAVERDVRLEDLLKPFPIRVGKDPVMVGAILCEDMWCDDYAVNPTGILVKNGAETIVNLSTSPWTWRKNDKRNRVVRSILEKNPVPFVYDNAVGTQNNGKNLFLFDGASTIYNSDGSLMLTATTPYKEETIDVKINLNGVKTTEIEPPILSDERDLEELYQGLIYGIGKYFSGLNKRAIIGISGGIDSAVSACLLVDAIGVENVTAVNMPSKFSSVILQEAARELVDNLGIEDYQVISIQESVDLTVDQLRSAGKRITDFDIENIQARDRGSRVLSGDASPSNAIIVNNGNKVETALGYATLHGDIIGGIAPLGDVYKAEVYQLAEYINKIHNRRVIPQVIFDVPPSAELSKDQDVTKGKGDPIQYPYHDKLIRAFVEFRRDPEYILDLYKNGTLEEVLKVNPGLVAKYFPTAREFITDLEEKWSAYKRVIHKRVDAPMIIAVSKRAFGFDLREAQNGVYFTQRYQKLKKELLASEAESDSAKLR